MRWLQCGKTAPATPPAPPSRLKTTSPSAGVAAPARRRGKCHFAVARAAQLSRVDLFHRNGGRPLGHLKNSRMAIGATQPLGMDLVGENYLEHLSRGRDEFHVERKHRLIRRFWIGAWSGR